MLPSCSGILSYRESFPEILPCTTQCIHPHLRKAMSDGPHGPLGPRNLRPEHTIPPSLNDLLVKLRVLSLIERGHKVNISTVSFTSAASWWGSIRRCWMGECRRGLLSHISGVLQQTSATMIEYQDSELCGIVVNSLANARQGVANLRETYAHDPNMVAQVDIFLTTIDLQLEKYQHLQSCN